MAMSERRFSPGFVDAVLGTVTGVGRWRVQGDVNDAFVLAGLLRRRLPFDPDDPTAGHNIGIGYDDAERVVVIRIDDPADVERLHAAVQEAEA